MEREAVAAISGVPGPLSVEHEIVMLLNFFDELPRKVPARK